MLRQRRHTRQLHLWARTWGADTLRGHELQRQLPVHQQRQRAVGLARVGRQLRSVRSKHGTVRQLARKHWHVRHGSHLRTQLQVRTCRASTAFLCQLDDTDVIVNAPTARACDAHPYHLGTVACIYIQTAYDTHQYHLGTLEETSKYHADPWKCLYHFTQPKACL